MSKPITVTVINEYEKQPLRLLQESGQTVLHTMRESGMELPAFCDGIGKCGRCRIRFDGYAPLPTPTERALLEPEWLRKGYRLACMARPVKDCVVECAFVQEQTMDVVTESRVTNPQYVETIQDVKPIQRVKLKSIADDSRGQQRIKETMIAVDIGTTTIAMQLMDIAHGEVLETYTCMNPQRSYGADVISRIKAASEGAGERLQELVSEALKDGVRQLKKRIAKYETMEGHTELEGTVDLYNVEKPQVLCIACNTAMGHIFLGYDTSGLGKSPFRAIDLRMIETEWEGLRTIVLPGISAFVGGDVVAGLYAWGLCDAETGNSETHGADTEESDTKNVAPWLFIDLGTNAEMVMGAGGCVVCTAAAAGPAFEGRGKDGALAADRVAAVAKLLKQGLVDETGLLAEPYFSKGIEVEVCSGEEPGKKSVFITQEDIRQLQMAKAAVRTGIHFLMEKLGIKEYEQIQKVWVAGGFGFFLDMDAAGRVGLLPENVSMKAESVGNTALAGAGRLGRLFATASEENVKCKAEFKSKGSDRKDNVSWNTVREMVEKYTQTAEVFNLAEETMFEQIYVEFMNFPLK